MSANRIFVNVNFYIANEIPYTVYGGNEKQYHYLKIKR